LGEHPNSAVDNTACELLETALGRLRLLHSDVEDNLICHRAFDEHGEDSFVEVALRQRDRVLKDAASLLEFCDEVRREVRSLQFTASEQDRHLRWARKLEQTNDLTSSTAGTGAMDKRTRCPVQEQLDMAHDLKQRLAGIRASNASVLQETDNLHEEQKALLRKARYARHSVDTGMPLCAKRSEWSRKLADAQEAASKAAKRQQLLFADYRSTVGRAEANHQERMEKLDAGFAEVRRVAEEDLRACEARLKQQFLEHARARKELQYNAEDKISKLQIIIDGKRRELRRRTFVAHEAENALKSADDVSRDGGFMEAKSRAEQDLRRMEAELRKVCQSSGRSASTDEHRLLELEHRVATARKCWRQRLGTFECYLGQRPIHGS